MNILFMSLSNYKTIYTPGMYADLLRCFIEHGDKVYILSPFERGTEENERVINEVGATIVKIKIWKMQKTNIVEKGISMLTIDGIFIKAIKKHFSNVKFDLVLYPTPPISLLRAVAYVKKRDGAKTYLMLKDIFPQNAVDIGLMSKSGAKGALYRYFRNQEKKLYAVSDHIGCMSQANVDYVIKHNPEVNPEKVEVCPNTTDPRDKSCTLEKRIEIRKKYGIPEDKTVFVYGGNLGKPQGIPFIIECLRKCSTVENAYFLIVGDGTEYGKLEQFVSNEKPTNVKLMKRLPKEDYDTMVGACDVGLIFLDHRFTIPNFPSRLLAYMQAKLPVLAATDPNTDIGKVIVDGGFGWWCESDDADGFYVCVNKAISSKTILIGENGYSYLRENYTVQRSYQMILQKIVEN